MFMPFSLTHLYLNYYQDSQVEEIDMYVWPATLFQD